MAKVDRPLIVDRGISSFPRNFIRLKNEKGALVGLRPYAGFRLQECFIKVALQDAVVLFCLLRHLIREASVLLEFRREPIFIAAR